MEYSVAGFDEQATGIGYYCPASVQALFRYFGSRNEEDDDYLDALGDAAKDCAKLAADGKISLANHSSLLMSIIEDSLFEFSPEWLPS